MRYRFAEFTLDTDRETLSGPDGAIPLRRRAFALLATLLENAPALVTRDRILDEVWGHDALSPNVLPQAISEIRQALADNAQAPRLIETRHRRGYRIRVPVARGDATDAAPPASPSHSTPAATEAPPPAAAPPPRRRRAILPIASAAMAIIALLAVAAWWRAAPRTSEPAPIAALAILADRAIDAPEWLAVAGSELLTVALSDTDRLALVRGDGRDAGASSPGDTRWQFWVRDVLGADHALTGTWRMLDDAIAFDYTLLRLADGHVVHAAQARAADPAGTSREVARAVRAHFRLADPEPAWLAGLPAAGAPRAAYFRGIAALAQGDVRRAIAELETAGGGARARIALASAHAQAGDLARSRALFADLLASQQPTLAVGERLRLEAGAALADERPRDAIAPLRALQELAPRDSDVVFQRLDAEVRAGMPDAAAATLASLGRLDARHADDPRWHLADARLAALRHDQPAREAAALRAIERARAYARSRLVVEAVLEHASAVRAQGRLDDARDELQALLADAELAATKRPDVQRALGSLLRDLGEFDAAQAMLEAARAGHAALGRRSGEIEAVIDAHTVESERGHSKEAFAQLLRLEPDVAALDDPALLARFHNTLGVQATRNGDTRTAAAHLEQAATQARRANRPAQEAGAWNNLGQLYARDGRDAEAQAAWERALAGFRDSGDRMGEAITLSNLGTLAGRRNQPQHGEHLHRDALQRLRALGARQHVARTAFNLGLLLERQGDIAGAAPLFDEAFAAYRGGTARDAALHALTALARTHLVRGDPAAARATLDGAADDIAQARDPLARSLVDALRGRIEEAGGDFDAARRHHRAALALRRELEREDWAAMSELALHRVDLVAGGSAEKARADAERIAARFTRSGDENGELEARLLESAALIRLRRGADATGPLDRAAAIAARGGDLGRNHEIDRLRILASDEPVTTRAARLLALAEDAARSGLRLFALRCRLDAAEAETASVLREEVEAAGLAGLLHPLP